MGTEFVQMCFNKISESSHGICVRSENIILSYSTDRYRCRLCKLVVWPMLFSLIFADV